MNNLWLKYTKQPRCYLALRTLNCVGKQLTEVTAAHIHESLPELLSAIDLSDHSCPFEMITLLELKNSENTDHAEDFSC